MIVVWFSTTARSCRGAPDLVNAQTHEGESACYLAAQRGHLRVVRLLLKAHADIDQMTNDLSCPLYAGEAAAGGICLLLLTSCIIKVSFPQL